MEAYECPVCLEETTRDKFPCTHGVCDRCFTVMQTTNINWRGEMLCPMCRAVVWVRPPREPQPQAQPRERTITDMYEEYLAGDRGYLWRIARINYLLHRINEAGRELLADQHRLEQLDRERATLEQRIRVSRDRMLDERPEYHRLLHQSGSANTENTTIGGMVFYIPRIGSDMHNDLRNVARLQAERLITPTPPADYTDVVAARIETPAPVQGGRVDPPIQQQPQQTVVRRVGRNARDYKCGHRGCQHRGDEHGVRLRTIGGRRLMRCNDHQQG